MRRRARAIKLKADCVVLLDRITASFNGAEPDRMARQIAEMRMRLAPPTGVKAPIVHTDFTKG